MLLSEAGYEEVFAMRFPTLGLLAAIMAVGHQPGEARHLIDTFRGGPSFDRYIELRPAKPRFVEKSGIWCVVSGESETRLAGRGE